MLKLLFFLLLFGPLFGAEPLAVYLTWQKSPETTMTISWLTTPQDKRDQIFYRSKEASWEKATGAHITLPDIYPSYFLHRVELTNLTPNQEYFFRIGEEPKEYLFKTMPRVLEKPLSFIVGGDVYHDSLQILRKMNKIVSQKDPSFVLLGGDLAYAMGKASVLPDSLRFFSREQRRRWIDFISALSQDLVSKEGRLIPFLASIGNHDVNGGFARTPKDAPQYALFFPLPGAKGFDALTFGNYMRLIFLDSGHTHPIQGKQTAWLKEALNTPIPYKFALYHVPAYPSVRDPRSEPSRTIRKYWPPLFEAYRLTAAFEHHEHAYKRTNLLGNVLYLGDGAWGVAAPRVPKTPQERPYLAKSFAKRNVILVTLTKDACRFLAIDEEGDVFDEVSR